MTKSLDSVFLGAIVAELQALLPGSQVSKVFQPDADTVILRLWNGRATHSLLLGATPGRARLHLTQSRPANPAAPPRFCQLLRARLRVLTAVRQSPGQRLAELTFHGPEGASYRLLAELYGRRPNLLLLTAEGRIVDALHRQPGALPGAIYQEPPPPGATAAGAEAEPLAELYPAILEQDGIPRLAMAPRPAGGQGRETFFDSPSAAADAYYMADATGGRGSERTRLQTLVSRAVKRCDQRLRRIEDEEAAMKQGEDWRRMGELLLANLHRVRRGMTELEVDDLFAGGDAPRLRIPLDARLSPQENAQRLFQRSKKARRGLPHAERRRQETHEELAWLASVELALETAASGPELAAIAEELAGVGLLPKDQQPSKHRLPTPAQGIREGRSPGGWPIFWGTRNRANDYLSRHLCRGRDLWFHALDRPGCHLVLRCAEAAEPVAEADILFAAALAAGCSRAAGEGKAEVMVAEGRYVRKPKGALPGRVQVDQFRTVRVAPIQPGAISAEVSD
jgi:predicted ribosome quality control (RQC) complex YloA/Tae2 family protein